MVCLDLFLDFEGDCGFSIISGSFGEAWEALRDDRFCIFSSITGSFGLIGDEWEALRDDGFCVFCSILYSSSTAIFVKSMTSFS
jgi:hypothetical protein